MNSAFQAAVATQEKAFRINMDRSFYGTFAEIGAGQETANWFFRASGASGTVAKTISAYDMTVSDALYGPASRYVSEERLKQMMDYEYAQLVDRLAEKRGADTRLFAFCSTVKCKGYKDKGSWFAWIGLRFQLKPGLPPSDLVMHVRLKTPDHDRQMQLLGILGVNLLDAAFYKRNHLDSFVLALGENLQSDEFDLDMLRFSGHGFSMFDNRLLALQLVQSGLCEASLFQPDSSVAQPSDLLYKRPIVLMRGSFSPLCKIHIEIMDSVRKKFRETLTTAQCEREIDVCEISLSNLLRGKDVDLIDFIDRVDALAAQGKTVMVTNMTHFHSISTLLNQYTQEPIAIAISIGLLNELFKEKWVDSSSGIFVSMSKIFINETRFYITPWLNRKTGELVTAHSYVVPKRYTYLYRHLMSCGDLIDVPYYNMQLLSQTPRDIIEMIQSGNEQWREYVANPCQLAADHIKERGHLV